MHTEFLMLMLALAAAFSFALARFWSTSPPFRGSRRDRRAGRSGWAAFFGFTRTEPDALTFGTPPLRLSEVTGGTMDGGFSGIIDRATGRALETQLGSNGCAMATTEAPEDVGTIGGATLNGSSDFSMAHTFDETRGRITILSRWRTFSTNTIERIDGILRTARDAILTGTMPVGART